MGTGGLIVEDGIPGAAVVVWSSHAAIHRADVEDIRLTGNAAQARSASAASGPTMRQRIFRRKVSRRRRGGG